MFMTAIFMFCSRKRKWFRCNVAEIAGTMLEIIRDKEQCKRKGCIGWDDKRKVLDTTQDCPVLRTGVACEKPVPESWNTLQRGVIRISATVFPHTTKPPSSAAFILEDAAGRIIEEVLAVAADDRQVLQSGKPLCTGASLWAVSKLAMGRLPLGTPANLPVEKLWLILFMKNRMKKGDEDLCENEIIQ